VSAALRTAAVVSVASALACSTGPSRIAIAIRYDDAWAIDTLEAEIAGRGASAPAQHALELWVPDMLDQRETVLSVRALRRGETIAIGRATVVPRRGTIVAAEIVLVAAPCGAWCTDGETRCFLDAAVVCETSPEPPCTTWSAPRPCEPGAPQCSNGTCAATCIDECATGEATCEGSLGRRECGEHDGDPCTDWSAPIACEGGDRCSAGSCVEACRDACESGARACEGGATRTCSDLDGDGCTEWGPSVRCPGALCTDGACAASCEDECTEDACAGDVFHRCGQFDGDPCLDRSPGLSCVPADPCLEGACAPGGCITVIRECIEPPPASCVGPDTRRVYDAIGECVGGGCRYPSRDVACTDCATALCSS
jgi:hypothetical protein